MRSPSAVLFLISVFFVKFAQSQSHELLVQGQTGKLYLEHTVVAKENWYSVGRLYNVSPKELAPFNQLAMTQPLSIGQTLEIPLTAVNFSQNGQKAVTETLVPVYHIIQEKEWMYRISVNHNKVPIPSLEKWNNVNKDQIHAGMHLIVGYLRVKTALSALATAGAAPVASAGAAAGKTPGTSAGAMGGVGQKPGETPAGATGNKPGASVQTADKTPGAATDVTAGKAPGAGEGQKSTGAGDADGGVASHPTVADSGALSNKPNPVTTRPAGQKTTPVSKPTPGAKPTVDSGKNKLASAIRPEPSVGQATSPVKPAETGTAGGTGAVGVPPAAPKFNGGAFRGDFNASGKSADGQAGTFKSTSGWQDGKYYALMNNIAVGTIVKVNDPSTGKTIYAKILGQLPDMKESAGLAIRISNAAAAELGEGEVRFAVEVRY